MATNEKTNREIQDVAADKNCKISCDSCKDLPNGWLKCSEAEKLKVIHEADNQGHTCSIQEKSYQLFLNNQKQKSMDLISMRAYFHEVDYNPQPNQNKSMALIQNLINQFPGKRIVIALPVDDSELTFMEQLFLSQKKFVMNDVENNGYNILGGTLPEKGKPENPHGLEEPALTNLVLGKGSPTDPNGIGEAPENIFRGT